MIESIRKDMTKTLLLAIMLFMGMSAPIVAVETKAVESQPQRLGFPAYCAPDAYEQFLQDVANRQNEYPIEPNLINLWVWPHVEIRNYSNPEKILRVVSKKDYQSFHIGSYHQKWQYINSGKTNLEPPFRSTSNRVRLNLNGKFRSRNILLTRLRANSPIQLEIKKLDDRTFRVDYQQIFYKPVLPTSYGPPGAYIFKHRGGCWYLMQDLRTVERE